MKRILVISPALLILTARLAWGALGAHDDIVLDYVKTGANNLSGSNIAFPNNGGPFWAVLYEDDRAVGPSSGQQHDGTWVGTDTSVIGQFFTFCVQRSVTFNPGNRYDLKDLQVRTLQSAKVLTGYGAWVFDKFNKNVLNSVINPRDNLTATKTLLGEYQKAIWMGIVGWTDSNSDGVFQYSEALGAVGGSTAEWVDDPNSASLTTAGISYAQFLLDTSWTTVGSDTEYDMLRTWNGIELMNLQSGAGADAQDQMIAYGGPSFGPVVPEPASILVWSILAGSCCAVALRRKRQRAPRGAL